MPRSLRPHVDETIATGAAFGSPGSPGSPRPPRGARHHPRPRRRSVQPLGTLMMLTLIISVSPAQPPLDEGAAASLASTPPGPSPETLGAIDRLLHVQRFTLRSPYVYEWSAEGLEVRDGIVFVIAVDPLVSRPLQTGSAVLYMGGRPAEIV